MPEVQRPGCTSWRARAEPGGGGSGAPSGAQALGPRSAAIRVDLGDLYRQHLSRPQDAIAPEGLPEAIAIEPANAGAHYALGVSLAQLGKIDDARTALKEAARLAPKNPLVPIALGALSCRAGYRRAGEGAAHRGAQAAYTEALRLDPEQALALNNLAWMAAEDRTNLDEALAFAEKATQPEAEDRRVPGHARGGPSRPRRQGAGPGGGREGRGPGAAGRAHELPAGDCV